MKIAILGYGKMGKKINELASIRGHHVVCKANSSNPAQLIDFSTADVAIDFSLPTTAFKNISHAINSGIPIISGTTGWLDKLNEIKKLCKNKNGTFLYASNFSLGVNIFFEINKKLAKLMKNKDYKYKIHEVHHNQKIDSPSGTAITLAAQMEKILKNKKVVISSERTNDIVGTHQIIYSSELDKIEIKHTAISRDGFALGAIIAAEWIKDKKGIYNLKDIFL